MRSLRTALWHCLAALAILGLPLATSSHTNAATDDDRHISLLYVITVAGLHVGNVNIDGTFNAGGYTLTLSGATAGLSRWMADSSAWMAVNGTFRGALALPTRFEIGIEENDIAAEAQIRLTDRSVMDLHVVPGLEAGLDIVPLTLDHVQNVVDPMSALFVPIERQETLTGEEACNRTLSVFDGWQRYDIAMFYRRTETVFGARAAYAGPAFICSARYVPIAGHSLTRPAIAFMSDNQRLEAQLIPAADVGILIPFRLLVGTEIGDLVIRLEELNVD